MKAEGTFTVKMHAEPAYDEADGTILGRARFDKVFEGDLVGFGTNHALLARTATQGSAAYVACERVRGTLHGKSGSFVIVHLGLMDRGKDNLQIPIVPDSGSDALTGISGSMTIRIENGQHFYSVEYSLPGN
jgi:Protein of unknown function (DUF3224)